jgi:hypothetical protein
LIGISRTEKISSVKIPKTFDLKCFDLLEKIIPVRRMFFSYRSMTRGEKAPIKSSPQILYGCRPQENLEEARTRATAESAAHILAKLRMNHDNGRPIRAPRLEVIFSPLGYVSCIGPRRIDPTHRRKSGASMPSQ